MITLDNSRINNIQLTKDNLNPVKNNNDNLENPSQGTRYITISPILTLSYSPVSSPNPQFTYSCSPTPPQSPIQKSITPPPHPVTPQIPPSAIPIIIFDSDSPSPSPIPIITLDSDSPSASPTSSEINKALEEFLRDLPDLEEESHYLEYYIDPEELTN